MENKRGNWGTTFGFLMAAVGSAVGLGNIWGFPYKMGANGGFAFLLVYFALAVLVGFVIMLSELAIGRKTGLGVIGAYKKISREVKWLGWLGAISPFLIMTFYSVLGGYCLKYIVVNAGNLFNGVTMAGGETFTALLTNQGEGVIYTVIFMIATAVIVMGGIKGGIEKFSKIAMPALFVMLLAVIIRSVTLPGAGEGIAFILKPNFEPLKNDFVGVLATAGGQMFFSLSLGMGIMVTYGSYLPKKENLEKNSLMIIIADTVVALMAAFAVIPAAFALGGEGAAMAGPSLLFVTLQTVFQSMGAIGPIFGIIFYFLVFIAAITSAISLVEVISTFFMDKAAEKGKEGNRKAITIWTCVAITALAVIVALDGLGSNGLWQPLGKCWLDFMDMWSEGIMMPLGAFFTALIVGYELGTKKIGEEIEEQGNRFRTKKFFSFCVKYVAPLAMVFILIGQLQSFGIMPAFAKPEAPVVEEVVEEVVEVDEAANVDAVATETADELPAAE